VDRACWVGGMLTGTLVDHHGYGGHLHWHIDIDETLHLVLLSAHHVVGPESALDDRDLGQHHLW
jgi:hypothetical protein